MTSAANRERTATYRLPWVFFLVASSVNGALLWHFHDRYWYPTDDGLYAHIAERLLSGEILNLDVQDIHPGYIHFLHAAAFRLFGLDMVSLRYPLMLAAFVQSSLVYALLQRRNVLLAALGSIAITALGVIQFVDPTANWYCLALCVMLACWLTWLPPANRVRLVGAGFLVGMLTLFRQLSGVWVAMAVLVIVLVERSDRSRGARAGWTARALLVVMLVALVGYLVVSPETEPGGVVLIAVWPIAILGWSLVHVRIKDAVAGAALLQLAVGATFSVLPLALYHLVHRSFGAWITDTVLVGFGETQMSFFGHGWFGVLPLVGLYQIVSSADATKIVNGLYWTILPLVSVANGLLILARLRRTESVEGLVLPVLAAFYALVSLYLEGPLYLYYGVGLSLAALLWLVATAPLPQRAAWATAAAGLTVVAIVFHAGQSRLRTSREILEGRRVTDTWRSSGEGLARCNLHLDESDHNLYKRLVDMIQAESRADESILALPNDAELYFLANRRSPVRFYNSALGLRTSDDLAHVIREVTNRPPRLVMFRPDDKYNTDASRQIMDVVKARYAQIDTIGGLEIYRLP